MNASASPLSAGAGSGAGFAAAMVRQLVLKDWYFHRFTLAGYLAAGAVALGLVAGGGTVSFYAGSLLLITVLISLGIHLPMATVIDERKNHNLAFVMSLPISAREYTLAKVLANLLIVLVPWLALLIGAVAVIGARPALPDGLIPFAVLVLLEIFASSSLILAVALVSESLGWTVAAIVFGNLSIQGFLYYASHLPSVAAAIKTESAAFVPAELYLLLALLAATAAILALTFHFQARKKDFV